MSRTGAALMLPVREVLPNQVFILGGYDPVNGGTTTFAIKSTPA